MVFGKKSIKSVVNKSSLTKLALAGIIAGGFMMTACEKTTGSASEENKTALAKFKADCEATAGRTYQALASCTGTSSCAGESFDVATGVKKSHDCKGKNTCAGGTCLDSTKKMMTAADSLKAKEAEIAAKIAAFKAACVAPKVLETIASCTGTSNCAGTSILTPSGVTKDHVCKGHNDCAGFACVDVTKKV